MSQEKNIPVVVAVPKLSGEALQTVVKNLKKAGLTVHSTLDKLGLVTGAVAAAKMASLSRVEGVTYVRPQGEVQAVS
jgi:hypothetical protein